MNVGGLSTACSAYCAPSKDSENAPNPHRVASLEKQKDEYTPMNTLLKHRS